MSDMTYVVSSHIIGLKGVRSGIDETMCAVVDGLAYDILLVQNDSQSVMTWLMVNVVK